VLFVPRTETTNTGNKLLVLICPLHLYEVD